MVFAKSNEWCCLNIDCLKMVQVMEDYARYLSQTNNKMMKLHTTPPSIIEKNANVKELPVNENPFKKLKPLDDKLRSVEPFVPINVREFLEGALNRKQIYDVIHTSLHLGGLSAKAVHYSYIPGGQKPALHFVWGTPENSNDVIQKCVNIIREIEANIPSYERRITMKTFKETYGFVTSKVAHDQCFAN